MKYRLIASDIDGTLIKNDLTLTQRTKDAISTARARGLIFTLASGRGLANMEEYLPILGADTPVITYNGAVIADASGKKLFEKNIDAENVLRIMELGWRLPVTIVAWADGRLLVNKLTDAVIRYQEFTGERAESLHAPDGLAGRKVSKILWFDNPDGIRRHIKTLDGSDTSGFVYFTSNPSFLEFVSEGVSKGLALAQVGELLGVSRREIIAVGDGMNDLSMIEYAGLGVAMGNAPPELKAAAGLVADTNERDGLAKIIEEYMLR